MKRGKPRWADKTPRYTLHMAFIVKLFPDCKFVCITRHPYDVVLSYRRRLGYKRAIGSVLEWRRYAETVERSAQTLARDRYVRMTYEDLVTEPGNTI